VSQKFIGGQSVRFSFIAAVASTTKYSIIISFPS
jgi:hypothetical protein